MGEGKDNGLRAAGEDLRPAAGRGGGNARLSRSGSLISGASGGDSSRGASTAAGKAARATRASGGSRPSVRAKSGSVRTAAPRPRTQGRAAGNAYGRRSAKPAGNQALFERLVSNKALLAVIAVVLVVAVGYILDTASNWGRAYGNVTVNGASVAGMSAEEIEDMLKGEYAPRVSHAQVTIYANAEAQEKGAGGATDEERAIAEQISAEEASSSVDSWMVDALSLKAVVPYARAAEEALSKGREGGLPARLDLLFNPRNVELGVDFDPSALEEVASQIDQAIGDPRVDTGVVVEGGVARAVEGHSGTMVDRAWLDSMVSRAMISGDVPDSFVAFATPAPSRIGMDEARQMADAVNRAIGPGAVFFYQGSTWRATSADIGDWTEVSVAGEEGSWRLEARIDPSAAIPAVMDATDAAITSEDMTVKFENDGSGITVHTSGSGNIPEVAPAISELAELLYGEGGSAWGQGSQAPVEVSISESDRPESLSFDEALDLGVITVIGEYTTEFSNLEGTENRNHNIKLCADLLDDAVIEANGGEWNFNERSGDTNEEAGFWSAGSIVDGEFVDSIGGGICQVATTIFNAVYEAGLDVVERHNHTIYIASYPTGRDAAVSYPDLDFIWENKLASDILMKLDYTDSSITAKLYSVYTGYSASTETGAWEEGKKYDVVYELDDSLASGYYYLKTVGEDGSSITIERTVRDKDGEVVKTEEFYSEYAAKDQVYVVGPDVDTSALTGSGGSAGGSSSAAYDYDDGYYDDYSGYGDYAYYGYDDDTVWY